VNVLIMWRERMAHPMSLATCLPHGLKVGDAVQIDGSRAHLVARVISPTEVILHEPSLLRRAWWWCKVQWTWLLGRLR
jgi:hypothetical protein